MPRIRGKLIEILILMAIGVGAKQFVIGVNRPSVLLLIKNAMAPEDSLPAHKQCTVARHKHLLLIIGTAPPSMDGLKREAYPAHLQR